MKKNSYQQVGPSPSTATANAYLMRVFKGDEKRVDKFIKQAVTMSKLGHPGAAGGGLHHAR